MLVFFWLSAFVVFYTYLGYPLLIAIMARLAPDCPESQALSDAELPSLTIIVPVFNEQANIDAKVATLKALDYPSDKIQIIFSSDGSSDKTHELVNAHEAVTLVSYPERQGKPTAINGGVLLATGEVLLFTDGRQLLAEDAARKLVNKLYRPNAKGLHDVGAVSGELIFRDAKTQTGCQVGLYWRYEKFLRNAESRVASVAGVTGALYVIRRSDFEPLPADTILDDFEVPITVVKQGKRCLFEPAAKVFDFPQENSSIEQQRKIRTLTGNFQSFARHTWLFHPFRNPIFIQFISHKVLRLLVPYCLLGCLVSNVFLLSASAGLNFYTLVFFAQILFYAIGFFGRFSTALRDHKAVAFSGLFLDLNWAAVLAAKQYWLESVNVKWDKTS